jgi:hypothetical protein
MFEELKLRDENLVPTSHVKIRSYVSNHNLDARQIKAFLRRLQIITEGHDVANLVLLLKELIPDYNPGAELLKTALSAKIDHAARMKAPVSNGRGETTMAEEVTPAALLN